MLTECRKERIVSEDDVVYWIVLWSSSFLWEIGFDTVIWSCRPIGTSFLLIADWKED